MSGPWLYSLECPVQKYDWGNSDPAGLIPTLTAGDQAWPKGVPAAELWMGAHRSAPARLSVDGASLAEKIASEPAHFLGRDLAGRGVTTLPFLFKILDAKRPLSIQAHPDKSHAEELHRRDPQHYPDDNHKPELAICLRDMRALVGFRPVEHIETYLAKLPELARLCKPEDENAGLPLPGEKPRDWIRALYSSLMRATPERIDTSARYLLRREEKGFVVENKLFRTLVHLFGTRDPGIFSLFFLNYVELKYGEAIFLGPNEPHAYLSGQILECMAASDNVVRAGLTGKFMDLETLLGMLHYQPGLPNILTPRALDHSEYYPIPVNDFLVRHWNCAGQTVRVRGHNRPSIFLVLNGSLRLRASSSTGPALEGPTELDLSRGRVFFLPGDLAERGIEVALTGSEDARIYQATVAPEF